MLRQMWLYVALLIFSSNLFAQNTTNISQPKTGRIVKNLIFQIVDREPIPNKKKFDYEGLHQVVHEAAPNKYFRFKVYPEPLRSRKMRIFEGGIPRMNQP